MKITVLCMGKGSKVQNVNGKETVIYYADFHVKKEINPHQQRFFGALHIESHEPFSQYAERKEYELIVSEGIAMPSVSEIKKIGNSN